MKNEEQYTLKCLFTWLESVKGSSLFMFKILLGLGMSMGEDRGLSAGSFFTSIRSGVWEVSAYMGARELAIKICVWRNDDAVMFLTESGLEPKGSNLRRKESRGCRPEIYVWKCGKGFSPKVTVWTPYPEQIRGAVSVVHLAFWNGDKTLLEFCLSKA